MNTAPIRSERQPLPYPITEGLPVTRAQFHEASVKRLWRRHFDEYLTSLKHGSHSAVEQLNVLIRTRARWRSLIRR